MIPRALASKFRTTRKVPLVVAACFIVLVAALIAEREGKIVRAPRVWDEKELADWATPVAGLNVPPAFFSEREYYAAPVENLRTYPVYAPDREPPGYWEALQKKKPEKLIDPDVPRTHADWIRDGQRVFEELDLPAARIWNPKVIQLARSREHLNRYPSAINEDGTIFGVRWVVTDKGVALGLSDCALCHTRFLPNGLKVNGAPSNRRGPTLLLLLLMNQTWRVQFPGDTPIQALYKQYEVPWIPSDIHEQIKGMSMEQLGEVFNTHPIGIAARPNGSPFYPAKIPDLIGVAERKWLDHTGTHRNRGIGDLMRYAALISCCDVMEFGPYKMLDKEQRKIPYRFPDELLFALATYITSLTPPPNPNPFDAKAAEGQQIFVREGCVQCHVPPLYTSNKLTPAKDYEPTNQQSATLDILDFSLGTDTSLALKTRKGTGFYKVPSLKGVWYRGLYLHDGSVNSLEDMFDPARLRDDYVPSGFKGFNVTHRAVPGHRFGLRLTPVEKEELLAFLRTL
jgi:hypothetical protein